jgi:hypothetical protein
VESEKVDLIECETAVVSRDWRGKLLMKEKLMCANSEVNRRKKFSSTMTQKCSNSQQFDTIYF